jgi:flagellar biosynthesis protein FliP
MNIRILLITAVLLLLASGLNAEETTLPLPRISVGLDAAESSEDVAMTLQILFLMTILSLAPALLILTTSFTRLIIVFFFLRQAMGTAQMPPGQVVIGLALFLTFFIMAPTWKQVNDTALQPYLNDEIVFQEALEAGTEPLREFMFKHVREDDLALFVSLDSEEKPATREDVSTYALIAAFALSELRIGFQIGFILFIPFLVIDMVIASILMSMGMMMMPPIIISLPFKLLLFIMVDGWHLIVGSLIASFG